MIILKHLLRELPRSCLRRLPIHFVQCRRTCSTERTIRHESQMKKPVTHASPHNFSLSARGNAAVRKSAQVNRVTLGIIPPSAKSKAVKLRSISFNINTERGNKWDRVLQNGAFQRVASDRSGEEKRRPFRLYSLTTCRRT